jgi:hypothetical protein
MRREQSQSQEDQDGEDLKLLQQEGDGPRQHSVSDRGRTAAAFPHSSSLSSSPAYLSSVSSGNTTVQNAEQRTTIDNLAKSGSDYSDSISQQQPPTQINHFHSFYDNEESDR